MSKFAQIDGLARAIGVAGAADVLARRAMGIKQRINAKTRVGRISIRPCDSDLFVASQTLGHQEYDIGPDLVTALRKIAREWRGAGVTPVIVDAGANVGYSALFFAETYPEAEVLAIEADPETTEELRLNTRQHPRVRVVQTALWSHERGVNLLKAEVEGSWANAVEEGGILPSATLDSVLKQIPNARILILKLDIEGAEREVAEASGALVNQAPCIIVEPHDFMLPGHGCLSPLLAAFGAGSRDTLLKGENIIFIDSALRAKGGGATAPA